MTTRHDHGHGDLFSRPHFDVEPVPGAVQGAHFNGPEYVHERDVVRLSGQILRVFNLMADGEWRTLKQIADATSDPHASISAQLRHLRKRRFGAHTVERRYLLDGLYQYRLIVNTEATA